MPLFSYKATDTLGRTVEGTMEAHGERAVVDRLHSLGYIPIRIAQPGEDVSFSRQLKFGRFRGVSAGDVLNFTQQLCTLLKAGLPMDRSLGILSELAEQQALKEIVEEILKDVQGGSTLANALAKHPKTFSKLHVNMVRAGEAGGFLPKALEQILGYLESAQELRNYISAAMMYPVILSAVGGLSIIILLTFVIPRFAQIFSQTGGELPLATQFLLDVSHIMKGYWWLLLLSVAGVFWAFKAYTGVEEGRFKWDNWKLKWFLLGNLIRKIEVSRFCRTLGTLIRSGIPILSAISIARETLGNLVMNRSMEDVYREIKEGGKMADVLRKANLFPALAVHMIRVGEESGQLDGMLLNIASSFENEVRTDVKRLVNLLEPAMILFMAVVVGFVVISMLLAIFSINELPL